MGLMARREPQASRPAPAVVTGRQPTSASCSSPPLQEQDGAVPTPCSAAPEASETAHHCDHTDHCHFSLQAQVMLMLGALLGAMTSSQGNSILPQLLASASPGCADACPAPRRELGGPCTLPAGQAFWSSLG